MSTVEARRAGRRPSAGARRAGYAIAAAVNLLMLYLVDVRPGWAAVPFLTGATVRVIPLVNLSLIVGVAVNLLYLAYDARWFAALGATLTTGVGLVVLIRIWQVFPFAFGPGSGWPPAIRALLVLAMAGSAIALIVQPVQLLTRPGRSE